MDCLNQGNREMVDYFRADDIRFSPTVYHYEKISSISTIRKRKNINVYNNMRDSCFS